MLANLSPEMIEAQHLASEQVACQLQAGSLLRRVCLVPSALIMYIRLAPLSRAVALANLSSRFPTPLWR